MVRPRQPTRRVAGLTFITGRYQMIGQPHPSASHIPRVSLIAATLLTLSACTPDKVAGPDMSKLRNSVTFISASSSSGVAALDGGIAELRAIAADPVRSGSVRFGATWKHNASVDDVLSNMLSFRERLNLPSESSDAPTTRAKPRNPVYDFGQVVGASWLTTSGSYPPNQRTLSYSAYTGCNSFSAVRESTGEMTMRQWYNGYTTFSNTYRYGASYSPYASGGYQTGLTGPAQSASLTTKHGCRHGYTELVTDYYFTSMASQV
jgi:hypothetical protein